MGHLQICVFILQDMVKIKEGIDPEKSANFKMPYCTSACGVAEGKCPRSLNGGDPSVTLLCNSLSRKS